LYFAVSADGDYAGYTHYPDTRCVDEMGRGRRDAISLCQRRGKECLIFAHNGDIVVDYEIRP